jgi:hypothetical protein
MLSSHPHLSGCVYRSTDRVPLITYLVDFPVRPLADHHIPSPCACGPFKTETPDPR